MSTQRFAPHGPARMVNGVELRVFDTYARELWDVSVPRSDAYWAAHAVVVTERATIEAVGGTWTVIGRRPNGELLYSTGKAGVTNG